MSVWRDKTTGKWRYKFQFQGNKYEAKGFQEKLSAQEAEISAKKEAQNHQSKQKYSPSLKGVAVKYLAHCRARMQKNTWRAKASYYDRFLAWLKSDPPMGDISAGQLNEYLLHIQQSEGGTNANRHLKDLKALWNWAMRQESLDINRNPCRYLDRFPEEKKPRYIPPSEDLDKVILVATQDDFDLLVCLRYTGARIGELLRLTWEDVNFEKRTITLCTRKRRGGQLQSDKLAMPETLFRTLDSRWQHRDKDNPQVFRYAPNTLRNLMRSLCDRAGVKQFGFHAIRHHVASILADSGKATLGQIQRFLRHRRQGTTEHYLHELGRDQREVAEILDASSPFASPFLKLEDSATSDKK